MLQFIGQGINTGVRDKAVMESGTSLALLTFSSSVTSILWPLMKNGIHAVTVDDVSALPIELDMLKLVEELQLHTPMLAIHKKGLVRLQGTEGSLMHRMLNQ